LGVGLPEVDFACDALDKTLDIVYHFHA
jgi:hypothetical protein